MSPGRGATVMAWIRLGRPRFLVAGFLLFGLGALLARPWTAWAWEPYAWGQAFVTATQAMVHYRNDLQDRETDARNAYRTAWSGGSGELAAGLVSTQAAAWTARTLGLVAVLVGVLAMVRLRLALDTAALLAATFLLAHAYSAPPWRLQARGWGPLVTATVVAVLVPLLGSRLQAGTWDEELLALVPTAFFLLALLLLLDLPDKEADAAVGKQTPTVRWGRRATGALALATLAAGYVAAPVVVLGGADRLVAVAVAASLPWGLALAGALARGRARDAAAWEPLQTGGLGVFLGTVAAHAALLALSPLLP